MRVTRLIREYVEEQVIKAYEPKIQACRTEYDEKKKWAEDICEKAVDELNIIISQKIKELGLSIDDSSNLYGGDIITYRANFGRDDWRKVYSNMESIKTERDNKIKDILVTLELGGTKEDLDRMIKEIAG